VYGFPLTLDDCYDDNYELRLILALKQQVNETMNIPRIETGHRQRRRQCDDKRGRWGSVHKQVVAVRSARFTARYTRPPCDHVGLWGSGDWVWRHDVIVLAGWHTRWIAWWWGSDSKEKKKTRIFG